MFCPIFVWILYVVSLRIVVRSLRFGFGSRAATAAISKPRMSKQSTLVIFVVGGITFKEVGQVQQVIEDWRERGGGGEMVAKRIILLSTCIMNPEKIVHMMFS